MTALDELVVATGNAGKLRELGELLRAASVRVIGQRELGIGDVPETGTTFVENALIKARHAARASGRPALADDSGLCVDALDGRPGVYSARFAGEDASDGDNLQKLLRDMQDVPDDARGARFCCVLVLMRHADDPMPLVCEGEWHGRITRGARGENGFGYDPVFVPHGQTVTSAQLAPAEKNRVSHRARALQALLERLSQV